MKWDLSNPFVIDIQVAADDIDGLGHANNAVYVSWLERCAWRHSQFLGLDLAEYRRLDRAMAVLPATQADVLWLVAVEELSRDEIALRLAITPAAVRSRLSRARAQLRAVMGSA